jgi:hypothetical protein
MASHQVVTTIATTKNPLTKLAFALCENFSGACARIVPKTNPPTNPPKCAGKSVPGATPYNANSIVPAATPAILSLNRPRSFLLPANACADNSPNAPITIPDAPSP